MEQKPKCSGPRPVIGRVYAESRLRTAGDDMPAHHWHPYHELFYVETGACSYMVENEIYDLQMGDFLLIPPHTFHYTRYRFGPCRRAAVFFREEDVSAPVRQALPGQEAFLGQVRILQTPQTHQARVEALLERMVREDALADRYTAPMLGAMLQELLLACCRVCTVLQEVPDRIHTTDREIVRAARFITEHYAEPITAADIAAAAGFSPNYLSRRFREAAGFGVHEYLTFIRLRSAAHELASTADSVTEVALRCGFSNSNYFKDAFKKQYGCTPRAYRQRAQGEY